ncbi:diguanylate cyclase [Pseudomonas sp. PCH446]
MVEGQFGGTQDAEQLAHKLIQLINEPVLIGAATVQVGVSIGIAVYQRDDPRTATQLLREADSRMYEAKQAGRAALPRSSAETRCREAVSATCGGECNSSDGAAGWVPVCDRHHSPRTICSRRPCV